MFDPLEVDTIPTAVPTGDWEYVEDVFVGTYAVELVEWDRSDSSTWNLKEEVKCIQLDDGRIYELTNFLEGDGILEPGITTVRIPSGSMVYEQNANIDVRGQIAEVVMNGGSRSRRLSTSIGTRSVLVVLVNADGVSPSRSEAQVSDDVFGTNGDAVNLVGQYLSCSHNQLNFTMAINDNVTDGVSEYWLIYHLCDNLHSSLNLALRTVSVSIPNNATGAYSTAIYNAAALQLVKQVNNIGQIDHVMYVLPVSAANLSDCGNLYSLLKLCSTGWYKIFCWGSVYFLDRIRSM